MFKITGQVCLKYTVTKPCNLNFQNKKGLTLIATPTARQPLKFPPFKKIRRLNFTGTVTFYFETYFFSDVVYDL